MFYVYILISLNHKRTYTGYTSNLEKRLAVHNNGEVMSSKKCRPYEIIHCETFETLKEAKAKESYFKSSLGRYHLRKFFEGWKHLRAAK